MTELQESGQMYLETILVLSTIKEHVRSIDVAKYMHFSKPSVSRAVNNLRTDGYLDIDNNGYITLTEKGHEIADSIYERHQVLTDLLIGIGVSRETAEEDACRVEHYISEETFEAIKKVRQNRQ